jgi:transcriptional regulator with XRE-family HTH domain
MTSKEERKQAIAGRFKAARENAGLSQGQLARRLGMSRPTISAIEAGQRTIAAEELETFAETFGVRVGWLTCTEDPDLSEREAQITLAARGLASADPAELESLIKLLRMVKTDPK